MTVPAYQKPLALGHRYLTGLFDERVLIQEKIDGSQLSFMLPGDGSEVECRSRGKQLDIEAPGALFAPAVAWVRSHVDELQAGWVYRAEAVAKPKHNSLEYEVAPPCGFVLFDVEPDPQTWAQVGPGAPDGEIVRDFIHDQANQLECSVTPTWNEVVKDPSSVFRHLDNTSILGGPVEGIVIKNYHRLVGDKPMMAKLVRDDFKEANAKNWRAQAEANDIISLLVAKHKTQARWKKAIQHRRETGLLLNAPQDIGPLMRELKEDFWEEEGGQIGLELAAHFRKRLVSGVAAGFPEWYKEQLLEAVS